MKFVQEQKKFLTNSVSKSRLSEDEKCPQKNWRDIRSSFSRNTKAKIFNILAVEKIKEIFKIEENISINKKLSSYKIEDIFEIQNSMNENIDFHSLFKNQEIISLGDIITVKDQDLELKIAPDLITYREIEGQSYISIYELKSSFSTSYEVDKNALFVAVVAQKKWGLPIIINRINLRSGRIWSEEISSDQIQNIEPFVMEDSKRYLERVNSDIIPEFTPGTICSRCEHIEKCDGRKYSSSLRNKYKISLWAKELAHKYDREIKDYTKVILKNSIKEEEEIVLPFLGGKYGAKAKNSVSYQLPNRKIKKQEVIKMLLNNEDTKESVINSLDIKFSENIKDMLEENFNISLKEVYKTTIKIEEKEE